MSVIALETRAHKIAAAMRELGQLPQLDCPLKHYFAPGVYVREIRMPAGAVIIGKVHKTEHFNIIQQGRVALIDHNFKRLDLAAPCTFVSGAGVQKVLYILEDTVWSTIHITNNRDLESLEAELIEPHADYAPLDRTVERVAIAEAAGKVGDRLLEAPV